MNPFTYDNICYNLTGTVQLKLQGHETGSWLHSHLTCNPLKWGRKVTKHCVNLPSCFRIKRNPGMKKISIRIIFTQINHLLKVMFRLNSKPAACYAYILKAAWCRNNPFVNSSITFIRTETALALCIRKLQTQGKDNSSIRNAGKKAVI